MKQYKYIVPLIWLAFWLRLWALPTTPPGLWYDEAYYAMDAAWLNDGGPWQLFFIGNNGREPIFIYLQSLFIAVLGAKPFTARLAGSFIGVLTVPMMYVWSKRLLYPIQSKSPTDTVLFSTLPNLRSTYQSWLPYIATFSLTLSFWHLTLSRGGFRGVLLPLFTLAVFYFFWRGWQQRSYLYLFLAGLILGLSQYTYLAARSLPLIFILFAPLATGIYWKHRSMIKQLWGGVILMALVSATVFLPLGWIFYQNPTLFSARTGDVLFTPDNVTELMTHVSSALRLFIDNGDPNWRHHLPGRPMLGWLGWLGFLPSLWFCVRYSRRNLQSLFLLTALGVLFLPALLSEPPVHALRLSSILAIYYPIFSWGLLVLVAWLVDTLPFPSRYPPYRWAQLLLALILVSEASLTIYDYQRWASHAKTYIEYNTPLTDLVTELINRAETSPVLIPLHLYFHPTTRYLLHDHFTETSPVDLSPHSVQLVQLPDKFRVLNVANIPDLPAYVWLEKIDTGQGHAYVSRPPRLDEQSYLADLTAESELYHDQLGQPLAQIYSLSDSSQLLPMFEQTSPQHTLSLIWGNTEPLAELIGYEVTPKVVQPNQPITLNLYWRSLTDQTFDKRLFVQLVNRSGEPINQWEGDAFMEDMYRWRPQASRASSQGILTTQHSLWVGPDTPFDTYLIRLGFFDADTKKRLPLTTIQNQPVVEPIDQVHMGLFYVGSNELASAMIAIDQNNNFADQIQLIGLTTSFDDPTQLPVTLYWQALNPTDKPYTVFLQLLNQQGDVVSNWDSQPFQGLYPTNLWSPKETLYDTFSIPLPENGLPAGEYRLITGFYQFETGQRLPLTSGSDFILLMNFVVD
ncbi:hypothetical protein QUF63_08100 [Anaerolineales bacterium HSG25]|nr:hypothetical protein [Anaerolineales bacterium HSG25]